ncbi:MULTISPECIES: DUF1240 domain-containing protein [Photorhabdus]|uniref:Photorhabdus luminescens subsp. laumondii TTO1 complete genome segment 4/17 n=2 Tax=Photorhabdus laumondii subsp. laumondii TaxID=141679 RepID=Q7N7E3_PHOLL|nr:MULTISPECIES: DUF1240 domain-containing protein [Photorhabdus]AWK41095.1 hypothetical protein A4R40_05960 [Photorhabdus laumondii subsp. laumondii]KTL62393.1 hypothetical protein AA106_06065 [Photorhabdus laumondii subsp. laumondii]RAW69145.1 DUF1240 domain-containing protein [Photorhabdus sp. S7-51]RAW70290.1 DUF1240 domain-containing protein [Photorhabdus sp. S14-60]RAW76670.1 DUF1240 domain-containing protein [Photorhabdus sp. S15-56]
MINKKKIMHIIGAFSFIILTLFTFFSSGENLISLVKMEDKIIFSGPVFMLFFAFPFLSYFIVSVIFLNIKNRWPKHHDSFINCFGVIAIVSFFLSFPLSFYVDYKLKSENYLICEKISWRSPNTYVKNIKLCD